MRGRRIYSDLTEGVFYEDAACLVRIGFLGDVRDGDYWKAPTGWAARLPNGLLANLRGHNATEHDDGTVTFSPSVLTSNGEGGLSWHGFLEHGIWRAC